jgi:purine-binding chemotaxis protein CheW
LLDVQQCVNLEFSAMVAATGGRRKAAGAQAAEAAVEAEKDDFFQIVSFVVDEQEYAFPIADIEEIVRVPEQVSRVPRADRNVIGIMNLRDRLLPLVSMRRIFGLPEATESDSERILVVALPAEGNGRRQSVGIVVDQVREVLRVERSAREAMPALLNRGREEQIDSICRLDDGKRLVSVLSSGTMFRHQVVESALDAASESARKDGVGLIKDESKGEGKSEEEENRLVVFNLATQEYGVMVEMIQEIIRVPEEMSRVPKTSEHIEGMVNLRGSVLPVLDMRARFGMPRLERNDRQRILVLNQAGVCTGFIVDSVSEVLRLPHGVVETAPHLSDEQTRIMGKVANLKERKRMIQILEASELVTTVEQGTARARGK